MPTPQISTFEELKQFIDQYLADNVSGAIDPADVRTSMMSLIEIQSLKNDLLAANLSPDQAAAWNALIAKLEQIQIGNNLGFITPATPAPPSTGIYRGQATVAGTYVNFGGTVVTQAELDANFVFIEVKDGVVTKNLSKKPEGANISPEFDQTNETEAQGGKQIFDASTILFDKAVVEKSGVTGSEILGFGTLKTESSTYASIRINNTPAPFDGYITEITMQVSPAKATQGVGFHVFSKNGSSFKNLTGTIPVTGFVANQETTIKLTEPIQILAGQFLGIGVNELEFYANTTVGDSYGLDGYGPFAKESNTIGVHSNASWCYNFKVERTGLTGDEVIELLKDLKNGGGSSGSGGFVYAGDFGVSAENTAESNTSILNNLISSAKKIILPKGILKHNGLQFVEGSQILGQGIHNTTLLNISGSFAMRDADIQNANQFYNGGLIQDMTIDGGDIAVNGLHIRNQFFLTVERVVFRRFANFCVHYTGVLTPFFNMVKFQESKNGIYLTKSTTSSVGYMQANMSRFTMCYFAELDELCVDIDGASNIVFDQCNFENAGIDGNINTGGIRAKNMSPAGEGTDILLINGWSEGIRGAFLNLSIASGRSVIQNHMIFKGGNGAGSGGTAVINNGCRLLLSGSTNIAGWTLGVLTTNGGKTFSDGFAELNGHAEETGGTFKIANYS